MKTKFRALLATALWLAPMAAAPAVETGAPGPITRIGATEKICQLTGDTDWETGRPTPGRTLSNFGLDAADLGYPVEHAGKLILLFGDSWPPPHPPAPWPRFRPTTRSGVIVRREPPTSDKCLEMQINRKPGAAKAFQPATIVGPTQIKQGFFNVPSGGVSQDGALFGFFWTDHCVDPNDLRPAPEARWRARRRAAVPRNRWSQQHRPQRHGALGR